MKLFINIFLVFITHSFFSQSIKTTLTYTQNIPSKTTNKTPVLIMLHGYGSNETDLFAMHKSFDNRYAVFSLRAPNSIPNSGYCWFPLDVSEKDKIKYDYNFVQQSKNLILSFISNACKSLNLDSTNVVLFGFSQGAMLSTDIAFTHPNKIKGVIALSGMLMPETQAQIKNDLSWKNINKVKMYFAHGYSDNVIKLTEAEKIDSLISQKKLNNLKMNYYKMSHNICGEELNDIKKWLLILATNKEQEKKINKK